MISPELYVQESQKIRDVLEESNDYLERIVETLVSSLDFTKESERQAAIRAENAELATIEAIREAKGSDLEAAGNIDGTAEEAGTSLGRSLSERFGGGDFVNRFRTGLSAGLAGLGARLLRGGPLAAIGVAFGDEIAKFLGDSVGDMLGDAGFTDSTVTAVEESLEKYTAPAITGAGIGMVFKRTLPGALAGIIISRLGLTQEDFVNTSNRIGEEIDKQFNFELPAAEDVGGFLEQGATGAGIGYLGGLLLGRFKIPLTIAGFIADYLGLDREKLNLFAEETAQQVENFLEPVSETPDYTNLNMQRDAAANLDLPTGQEVRRSFTRDELRATPAQQGEGSVYDRLSLWQRIKGMGPLQTDVSQAFDAADNLQINYLSNPLLDMNNLPRIARRELLAVSNDIIPEVGYIDDFLNMDPEVQHIFATSQQIQHLQQVRYTSEQMRMAINREQSQLNRPVDVQIRLEREQQEAQSNAPAAESYTPDSGVQPLQFNPQSNAPAAESYTPDSGVQPLAAESYTPDSGVQPQSNAPAAESYTPDQVNPQSNAPSGVQPLQVNPILGQNEVSQISKSIATSSSISIMQPVVNNFNSVDASTNVSGGGGRGAPTQLPAGASKSYDRSEQLYA